MHEAQHRDATLHRDIQPTSRKTTFVLELIGPFLTYVSLYGCIVHVKDVDS